MSIFRCANCISVKVKTENSERVLVITESKSASLKTPKALKRLEDSQGMVGKKDSVTATTSAAISSRSAQLKENKRKKQVSYKIKIKQLTN